MFAVYVDVRYETKGTFSPDMLDNSRSYREFIGYVIVGKSSTLELTVNETLLNRIFVVVLSVLKCLYSLTSSIFVIHQSQHDIEKIQSKKDAKLTASLVRPNDNIKMTLIMLTLVFDS